MKKTLIVLLSIISLYSIGQTQNPKDPCGISVPNILEINANTPLIVTVSCPIETFHFQLLNRWGEVVYETKTFSSPLSFDYHIKVKVKRKKYALVKIKEGLYIWKVTVKDGDSLNTFEKTGNVHIM